MEKEKHYKVEIKDFGPISHADIELKPLTLFIGHNNSGKSYASLLIYALQDTISNLETGTPEEIIDSVFKKAFQELTDKKNHTPTSEIISEKFLPYIESRPKLTSSPLILSIEEVNTFLKLGVGPYQAETMTVRIKKLFDQGIKELVRFNQKNFKIKLQNSISLKSGEHMIEIDTLTPKTKEDKIEDDADMVFDFKIEDEKCLIHLNYDLLLDAYIKSAALFISETEILGLNKIVSREDQEKVLRKAILKEKDSLNKTLADLFFNFLFSEMSRLILKDLIGSVSYYIPSDKSDKISNLILHRENIYNLTTREYLNEIYQLDENKKSDFYDLGEKFEEELIHGKININVRRGRSRINYERQDGYTIPYKGTSSSIMELTPIILYLKHVLKKGDLLIIDEPEAHLHPKNQRLYIKYIIRAVNQGLKVLITTHSDYILEQLNNLIKINKIQNKQDKDYVMNSKKYMEDDLLDSELVNIYHFKEKEDNVFEADKLEIGDFGIEESNFQDVVDDLYEETEMIDNLLTRNE